MRRQIPFKAEAFSNGLIDDETMALLLDQGSVTISYEQLRGAVLAVNFVNGILKTETLTLKQVKEQAVRINDRL